MNKASLTASLLLFSVGCFRGTDAPVILLCQNDGVTCPDGQVCVDQTVCADEQLINPAVDPVVSQTPFAGVLVTGKTLRGATITALVNGAVVASAVAEPDFDEFQALGDFSLVVPVEAGANQLTITATLDALSGEADADAQGAPLVVNSAANAPLFSEEAAARGLDFPVPARGNSRDESNNNGATFQDLDNDGDLDLVIGSDPDNVVRVNANGNFQAGAALINDVAAAFADLDNDGDLDAALSSSGANAKIFQNNFVNGQAAFAQRADLVDAFNSEGVLIIDTNGNGVLDVLFQDSGENRLFSSADNFASNDQAFFESFQDATGNASDAAFVASCDLDGDDVIDVVVSDAANRQVFLGNLGQPGTPVNGGFFNTGNVAGRALGCADLDNDGLGEIFAAEGGNGLRLVELAGNAPQQIAIVNANNADGASAGDIDNDGDLDLVVAADGADRLLVNQGGIQGGQVGTFLELGGALLAAGGNGEGVALGDFDGDGNLDAFVIDQNQPSRLYVGVFGSVHARSLRVAREVNGRLVDIIGAKVALSVNTAQGPQEVGLQVVDGGSAHGGQDPLTLRFGGISPLRTVSAAITVPGCQTVDALLLAGETLFSFAGDCP